MPLPSFKSAQGSCMNVKKHGVASGEEDTTWHATEDGPKVSVVHFSESMFVGSL